ncbi:MAG: aldehyde dehydrogenase family protein [Planctomycetota bacterium]|jgi:acyl-CoA reductase-like NAD-dependent aldehyde dehydrogenase
MPHFPILRWGEPYESLDVDPVVHFATGETLGEVSQANGGLIARDMRRAAAARAALRAVPIPELCRRLAAAADLFLEAELPAGDATQSPAEFMTCQSATTGLPEHMCRANMEKLHHVLGNLETILAALTRRLDPAIMSDGYGREAEVMRSRQPTTPVLGMVLPSNSPGTHGLWLPVLALQIGLVLKPGPQEPWTPYRMAEAFFRAGVPREAIALYPGGAEAGAAVVEHVPRKMIFGSVQTVQQYRGDPSVQVHGPGFSKILLGDDAADRWEEHLDLMVDSVLVNGGRSCINCSGIWTPRHGRAIAEAMAERLGPVAPLPPDHPDAPLAAFTVPKQAEGIDAILERDLAETGVEDVTARHRGDGPRLVVEERCAYLRPTVVHCPSPDAALANTEFMFPYASVVECPQDEMLDRIGGTLVATVISDDEGFRRRAVDATEIDRLNLGPIPTFRIDWLQPHEGNIVDFLYRERALQIA